MRRRSLAVVLTGALVAAAAGLVTAAPASAHGVPLAATLTGAAEVPGPGDPDGAGSITLTINPGLEELCYSFTHSGLATLVGAHVHRGTADVAGPVVVPLDLSGSGCATASRDLLQEIVRDPSAFYVNLHTTEHRPGAIRGQLHR